MKCQIKDRLLFFISPDQYELNWLDKKLSWENYSYETKTNTITSYLFQKDKPTPFTFAGLLDTLKVNCPFELHLIDSDISNNIERFNISKNILPNIELLDFQVSAIKKCLSIKTGICDVKTGGGKTEIILGVCRHLLDTNRIKKALIIVPSTALLMQLHERGLSRDFKDVEEIGMLYSGRKDFDSKIIVAGVATVYNGISNSRPEILSLLKEINFLAYDECHHFPSQSSSTIALNTFHVEYLLGFSGTPYRDKDVLSNSEDAFTKGVFGNTLYSISHKYLMTVPMPDGTTGLIAEPIIFMKNNGFNTSSYQGSFHNIYNKFIVKNSSRNNYIVNWARKIANYKMPLLILVQRKEHARLLMEQLNDLNVVSIFGSSESLVIDPDTRSITEVPANYNAFRENLGNGSYDIAIMNQIGDEGFDIPNVGFVINAGGMKSSIKINQRAGRGLRRKKVGPNRVFLLDFNDLGHVYVRSHSKKRLAVYEDIQSTIITKEEEFENIFLKHVINQE